MSFILRYQKPFEWKVLFSKFLLNSKIWKWTLYLLSFHFHDFDLSNWTDRLFRKVWRMTMMEIPTFNLFSRLRASLRPDLHFHSLHLDAPGCSRLIKNSLQFNNLVKTFFSFCFMFFKFVIITNVLRVTCIAMEILSLSLRISCRFLVPKMFLSEVWARSLKQAENVQC